MPIPDANHVALRLYERLDPVAYAEERYDYTLLNWLDAWTESVAWLDAMVRDQGVDPGWSPLLDVDRAPDEVLDYLGQYIGLTFNVGASAETKRNAIRNGQGLHRGSPRALVDAVQAVLTGTKTVTLLERHGSAYRFALAVLATEAPRSDWFQDKNYILDGSAFTDGGMPSTLEYWPTDSTYAYAIGQGGVVISGNRSAQVSSTGGGDTEARCHTVVDDPEVLVTGNKLSASVTVLQTEVTTRSFNLSILARSGGVTVFTASQGRSVPSGVPTTITRTLLSLPAGVDEVWVSVAMTGLPGTGGENFYFDDAILNIGDPISFFNGNSPGASWEGTSDASVSVKPLTTIVRDAALTQKPAGLVMELTFLTGKTYNDLNATHANYAEVLTDFATYDAVTLDPTHT